MSRSRKIIVIIILSLVVLATLYVVWRLMHKKEIYDCIPEDSVIALTIHNPVRVWQEFESSQVWNRFKTMQLARDIRLSMDAVNKNLGGEYTKKIMELIFHEQITLVSNTMEKFVLYADVGLKGELVRLLDLSKELFVKSSRDIRFSEETVNGRRINRIEFLENRKTFVYVVAENVLIVGNDEELVRKSVMAADGLILSYGDNRTVHMLDDRIDRDNKARLYVNMNEVKLDELMVKSVHPLISEIIAEIDYLGLGLTWDESGVALNMYSPLEDVSSHTLLVSMRARSVDNIPPIAMIPRNSENVVSLRLGEFDAVRLFTEEQLRRDAAMWNEYQQSRKMVEKDFGISLEQDVFSWIGDQMGGFSFQIDNREKPMQVVWIRATNADRVRKSLDHIKSALAKKLPIVFKDKIHKGVAISYIDLPLFLKIILNPIFQKISKPYWMVMEDLVLFSDDIDALLAVVETYKGDSSIKKELDFELMETSLSFDSNLFLYANMQPSIRYIKGFFDRSTAAILNKWQPYLLQFKVVGLNSNIDDEDVTAKLFLKLADRDESPIHLRWKLPMHTRISCPVTLGQFDATKGDEIVIADESGQLQVVSSEGKPLKGWPRYFDSAITIPLAIGDLNEDSRHDLVLINNKKIYALDRSGNSLNSAWPLELTTPVITYPVLSDVDCDGADDLIYVSEHKKINIINAHATPIKGWPQMTDGPMRSAPAVGDMDRDGSPEIVAATANGLVYVYDRKGRVLAPWPRATNSAISISPTLSDIDGNGQLDIVIVTIDGHVFVWSHDGFNLAGWPQRFGIMTNSSPAIGDIDGDGKPEIAIAAEDNKVYLFDASGNQLANWPCKTIGKISTEPVLGDVNGDGRVDVVVASDDGKIYAWNSTGEALSGWPLQGSETPALGDFDGDGLIDVVAGSWDQHCYYWGLNGSIRRNSIVWGKFRYDKGNTGAKPSR